MTNKHYNDLTKTEDKIIHLFYAGAICGNFDDVFIECIKNFGLEETLEAKNKFDDLYKPKIK